MSQDRPERIFHIATRADWVAARRSGDYTTSTLGRTLEQEGFIHASRREQVAGVFDRYYRGVREPLVLLTIAPERLEAEVREERVGDDTYPHIFGPVPKSAVVQVAPLSRRGAPETVMSLWLKGMAVRMGVALLVMALVVAVVVAIRALV